MTGFGAAGSQETPTAVRIAPQIPPRGIMSAIRRHRRLFVGLFCLTVSALLLVTPLLPRRYEASGKLSYVPKLPKQIADLSAAEEAFATAVGAEPAMEGETRVLRLTTSHARASGAVADIGTRIEKALIALNSSTQDILSQRRAELEKTITRRAMDQQRAEDGLVRLRAENPGVLPDEPSGIVAQFEKNQVRLEEMTARLRVLDNQIPRLEELRRKGQTTPVMDVPPPQPVVQEKPTPVKIDPDQDPEVVTLRAQLQLLNEQLEEQLTTMRRTEQHPYVVDLRNKMQAMEKKLENAKQRAATGAPPPPPPANSVTVQGNNSGRDTQLLANQTLDIQIQTLRAERDGLADQVKGLEYTIAQQREQVRSVLPVRERFETLNKEIASAKADTARAQETLQGLNEVTKKADAATQGGVVRSQLGRAWQVSAVEINAPRWPVSPRLSVVVPLALLAGIGAALVGVWLRAGAEGGVRSPQHFAALVDVPVLGWTNEIRSPWQRKWDRVARLGSLALTVATVLLLGLSVMLLVQRLGRPDYPQGFEASHLKGLLAVTTEEVLP